MLSSYSALICGLLVPPNSVVGRVSTLLSNRTAASGFPGGAVVGSPPANAGDTGSSPGLGGSHMPRSGWAREPQLLSLRVWSLCSATGEAAMARGPRTAMRSGPRLPQLEKALAQKRGPNTAINKKKTKKTKKKLLPLAFLYLFSPPLMPFSTCPSVLLFIKKIFLNLFFGRTAWHVRS